MYFSLLHSTGPVLDLAAEVHTIDRGFSAACAILVGPHTSWL